MIERARDRYMREGMIVYDHFYDGPKSLNDHQETTTVGSAFALEQNLNSFLER